ncbi:MAG: AAA family ATPase [Candidatus Sumerlaeota bacterium]|nr:AAA family ATPase [Candidatus Sumerlaeota bacterium]
MAIRLAKLSISGFKTFRELKDFEPGPINVMIGPNGAGKSNFISFFQLLGKALSEPEELRNYAAKMGGARVFLHGGPKRTESIQAQIQIMFEGANYDFHLKLSHAEGDSLWRESGQLWDADSVDVPWHKPTGRKILKFLKEFQIYQFNDTSFASNMRGKCSVNDTLYLYGDGRNLAAFLLHLRNSPAESDRQAYRRISDTVRLIAPFFSEFFLEPEFDWILLRWREHGNEFPFNVSQASDGMLRAMALIALLGQPEERMPSVLFIDEPELGLHPYAIGIIASMIKTASHTTQIFVATQSATLVDYFEPEDVIIMNRRGMETQLERKKTEELKEWLNDYSLGELWMKNILGGRPR